MSLNSQPAAYKDCDAFFTKAMDTSGGIRIPLNTREEAKLLQLRLHNYRTILRKQSRRIYPSENPLYDTSEFDALQVQLRGPSEDGTHWVYIRPVGRPDLLDLIEEIPEEEREIKEPTNNASTLPPDLD